MCVGADATVPSGHCNPDTASGLVSGTQIPLGDEISSGGEAQGGFGWGSLVET